MNTKFVLSFFVIAGSITIVQTVAEYYHIGAFVGIVLSAIVAGAAMFLAEIVMKKYNPQI